MPRNQFAYAEVSPKLSRRRRLLWVDDSEALLLLYKRVFENLGFDVLATSSPDGALHHVSSEAPDAAILDYHMPQMNGGDLALLMKNRSPMLPVILHTGSTGIPHGVHTCVDAVCAKGAPQEELVAMIERLTCESGYESSSASHQASIRASAEQA